MADAPVSEVVEAAVQPTDVQPTGAEPGKQTETAKTFTQAELDAIIRDRLAKEARKSEEAAKKAAADAEAKALKEQGEFRTLYEKEQARAQELEARARALELDGFRRDVVARKNLPAGLAEWLKGETLEDLEANADKLLANLPKPQAPNINAGDASAKGKPSLIDGMDIDNLAARLGISAKYAREYLQNGGS